MNRNKYLHKFPAIILTFMMIFVVFPIGSVSASPAFAPSVVAYDMVGSASQNLVSYTNPYTGAFASGGDGFQKYQRGVSPSLPFSMMDDSLTIYLADNLGIIKEGNVDEFFGATDTENPQNSGPINATWVFDISGATNLNLSIDMGAMGDFEAADTFVWTYQIDGGSVATAFTSSIDEAGSQAYVLDAGNNTFTLNDPMLMNGTLLNNNLQTVSTALTGAGSELTLTLTAQTNGGTEAVAFQNIVIEGEAAGAATTSDLLISEYGEGSGYNKYIEIYNGTGATVDLSGYTVWRVSNGGVWPEATITLSGSLGDGQVFVVHNINGGISPTISSAGDFQLATGTLSHNGDDAVGLVKNGVLIDAVGTDGADPGTGWAVAGVTNATKDHVLVRKTSVCDPNTDWDASRGTDAANSEWIVQGNEDWSNIGTHTTDCDGGGGDPPPPSTEACGDEFTPIYVLQGNGAASALVGSEVATEGIVVGDFQNGKDGFFIQDPTGDGDAATSDGVFVYYTGADVNEGDAVRVRGTVDEFYDLTQIDNVSLLLSCSTGNSVAPTAVSLPLSNPEIYEGMLVSFAQSLTISEYFNFGRYGELVLTPSRQFQPTAIFEPGSGDAAQLLADNLLYRIKVDDGNGSQNPDPAMHPNGSVFDLSNLFRGGDVLNNLTGVLDYNFGEYKIQPTSASHGNANVRSAQPDNVGGNLKVASFNVLNYFTTFGSRGADDAGEFARQRAKIFAALAAIDADIVGLIEIENNTAAIQDLVDGLNAVVGAGTYAYVDTGLIGTDAIKVAFIYKSSRVSLVGNYAVLDSSVDSRFNDGKNRPALAQTFMDTADGGVLTIAVNHLKSKGSSCDSIGDPNTGDGSGNCNLTRTSAAAALADWLATDPTNSGDGDFLIIGDLNAYDKESPIDAILAGGYTDLIRQFVGEYAYSYLFDGQLGYLDHALANGALSDDVSGVTVWHINADEPNLIDYDTSFKQPAQDALYAPDPYRSSDHDPVVIGMNVCDEIAPMLEVILSTESLWPANHMYVDVSTSVIATDNFDLTPTVTLLSVTSSEADEGLGDGDFPDDIVIIDDYTFQLRAERSGVDGEGRTYTVTYQVMDDCGNSSTQVATVFVPFSQEGGNGNGKGNVTESAPEVATETPTETPTPDGNQP